MSIAKLLLLANSVLAGPLPQEVGVLRGVVVNTSGAEPAACQATVVLQVQVDGQFVPLRETATDAQGEFRFDRLPVGPACVYLPGANRHDVHYPGPRVSLTAARPEAAVRLAVCDAVAGRNPLVLRQYQIDVCPEPGVLKVTESMLIDNPSSTCYVGEAPPGGAEPVTLMLAIPADFERVTFHKEFFGRRFSLGEGKLVTGIPWPPGRRELRFTYLLRNTQAHRLWERPLDLPCGDLRLRVRTDHPEEVACNLPPGPAPRGGDVTELTFASDGRILPAGHTIRLELGHLPVPLMAYGRWLAPTLLLGLVAGASAILVRRRKRARPP